MPSPQPDPPRYPTVLVVDDEDSVRTLARRMLELAGYTVVDAADGLQALAVLSGPTAVDVVISDLRMPGMDGRELASHLGRQWPHLPILFISGYDVYVGKQDLPGPVLPKPFGVDDLTSGVQQLLKRRSQSD